MQKDSLDSETLKNKMSDDSKELDDDMNEFEEGERRPNILSLMKNMMEAERLRMKAVDIFDDNNYGIYPTCWGKESQLATCRKCGKTGESIVKRKCGIGNTCCSCCFVLACMCCFIPCLCCFTCDFHHYCSHCKEPLGIKTLI